MATTETSPRLHAPMSCPACGAIFTAPAAGRRRRVQCPKCRETVVIEPPGSSSASQGAIAASLARQELEEVLHPSTDRIAELEARILTLERALETRTPVPEAPAAEPEPEPARRLKWIPRDAPETSDVIGAMDSTREEALGYNLEQSPGYAISIRSAAGNTRARQFAERIKSVFERSSWRVRGVDEVEVPSEEHGLALLAGSLPGPPELANVYLAFTAAGIELTPRLDPQLNADETVVIVAS